MNQMKRIKMKKVKRATVFSVETSQGRKLLPITYSGTLHVLYCTVCDSFSFSADRYGHWPARGDSESCHVPAPHSQVLLALQYLLVFVLVS